MTDTHPQPHGRTYARGRSSPRRRWATTAGIGLLGGPLIAGWMLLPTATAAPAEKVQICHATNSVSNPYTVNSVNTSSVDEEGNKFLNGHGDHTGPVFDPADPPASWGDIIPPITNPDTGTTFPGLNWPAGEAIWTNGCQVPTMSPSPTMTSPSPTETSPSPTETSPTPTETSPTPTETSPTPTETSPTPTETSPSPGSTVTVTATVTATQVIVVPGPGVTTTVTATPTPTETTPTPTETTVTPSPGTTSATPTQTSPTPTETTVTPSPGTTSPSPTTGTPTTTTLSPSPGVTVTGTGFPTGVAAGGGPMAPLPGIGDPMRPAALWVVSAGLTAMGLLAFARVRRLN